MFRGVVSGRQNDDLFFIDKTGRDKTIRKGANMKLKIDEIIEPDTSVSALQPARKTSGKKSEERLLKRIAPTKKTGKAAEKTTYDLWADEAAEPKEREICLATVLPAVPVPSGAQSYNPVPEEHLSLLQKLETQELERLESLERVAKQVATPEIPENATDMMIEANRKLLLGEAYDGSSEDEEIIPENETEEQRQERETLRKTRQQRNRQARHQKMLAEHAARRSQKQLDASIDQVPELLEELKAAEEAERALEGVDETEARLALKQQQLKKRLKLEPLVVKLPEELPSSMRLLAAEGNLVADRFRSFVERGIVDPLTQLRVFAEKKPAKKKRFKEVERYSYKNFK